MRVLLRWLIQPLLFKEEIWLTNSISRALTLAIPAPLLATIAQLHACLKATSPKWPIASDRTWTALVSVVLRLRSWLAAANMSKTFVRYARPYVKHALPSARNTNTSIAGNAQRLAARARRNVARWRRTLSRQAGPERLARSAVRKRCKHLAMQFLYSVSAIDHRCAVRADFLLRVAVG